MQLLDWARASGYKTPPIPWSLDPKNRVPAYMRALAVDAKTRIRSAGGKILRLAGLRK